MRNTAGSRHLHGQRVRVGIADLEFEWRPGYLNDLIAGRKNSHTGPPVHRYTGAANRRQHGNAREIETAAARNRDIAATKFGALRIDGVTRFYSAIGADAITVAGRVFDHHHGIGAAGNRRAGHDFDGLSRAHFAFERFTGADLSDQLQTLRHIGRSECEPIADRSRDWRVIPIGRDIFSEHPLCRIEQLDGFDTPFADARAYFAQHNLASFDKRDWRHYHSVVEYRRRYGNANAMMF